MATLLDSQVYTNHVEPVPLDNSSFSLYEDSYPREEIRSPLAPGTYSPVQRTELHTSAGDFLKHSQTNHPEPLMSEEPIVEEARTKVEEQKLRADYAVKLSVLREAYPDIKIPHYPDDQYTVDEIVEAYKSYKRRITIDSSVEQNKNYLLIVWLAIEALGARWMKEHFTGYTLNQFKMIGKYQELLIEMGERNYVDTSPGFPAETKIVIMTIINAIVFFCLKWMSSYVGIKDTDQIKEFIMNIFTNSKGDSAIKRAEQASADNIPAEPFTKEPSIPMGNMGNILGNLMSAWTGSGGNDNSGGGSTSQRKRPTGFAARTS